MMPVHDQHVLNVSDTATLRPMQWTERLIKEQHGLRAPTYAALLAPQPTLAACVRAYVVRRTLGAELGQDERLNHFPAAPTCALTWFMQGDYMHMQLGGTPVPGRLPWPVMFTGPHTQASVSLNPGPVDCFILLLLPDALHALTGMDIAAQVDRYCSPAEVFDADWQAMCGAVLQASSDQARVRIIEAFLLPRCQALTAIPSPGSSHFRHWAHALAMRAAKHADGRSERQVDRRIKRWTGLALRQLRGIGRAEGTLFNARAAMALADVNWADIAASEGFSDQAHLSREMRRITGMSPRELKQGLAHESYWMYQIWS